MIAQLAVAAQQALSSSTDVSRLGIAWHKLLRLFRHSGFVISFDNERDRSGKDCMAEVAKRLDGGFHHGVTKCHSNPTIKQVLYIYFKARVLLVDRSSYHCWFHPSQTSG